MQVWDDEDRKRVEARQEGVYRTCENRDVQRRSRADRQHGDKDETFELDLSNFDFSSVASTKNRLPSARRSLQQ